MIGASKILTVSYGTFSCTLEGFDDPFNTMRAIAEYFRDLAADDRYFGAEPPTPDAAMLHRIAEREVSRRVEARIQDNGVILRTGDAMTPGYAEELPMNRAPVVSRPVADHRAASVDPALADAAQLAPLEPDAEATPDLAASTVPEVPPPEAAVATVPDAATPVEVDEPIVAERSVEAGAPMPDDTDAPPDAPLLREVPLVPLLPAKAVAEAMQGPRRMPGGVAAKLQRARAAIVPGPVAERILAKPQPDLALTTPLADVAGMSQPDIPADAVPVTVPGAADFDPVEDAATGDVIPHAAEAQTDDAGPEPVVVSDASPFVLILSEVVLVTSAIDETSAPLPADAAVTDATDEDEDAFLAGLSLLIDTATDNVQTVAAPVQGDATDIDDSDDLNGFLAALADDRVPPAEEAKVATNVESLAASETDHGEPADADDDTGTLAALAARDAVSDAAVHDAMVLDGADSGAAPSDADEGDRNAVGTADQDTDRAAAQDGTADAGTDDFTLSDASWVDPDLEDVPFADPAPDSDTAALAEVTSFYEAGPLSEKAQRARARVIRIRRGDAPDVIQLPTAPALSAEAEADLAAVLASLEIDLSTPAADATARSQAESATRAEADLRRQLETPTGDESVTRLIAQTNSELQGPENRRRLSAIAHLKAAVAATVADRRAGAAPAPTEAARIDPYRHDLERVVRPRRPGIEPGEMPRPAPLVLVSAQRIDRPAAPAPVPVALPVRPRRVTSAALAPVMADLDDEDAAFLAEEANIFADTKGFAEFAERLGATDLPDLLEAAAAYCACVEGRPHFSRPHLMSHVAAVATGGLSREDGLRGFGRLMRMGRIVKLKRGQFALTEDSRLLAEARKIAG